MKRIPNYSNYSITTDGKVWSHNLRPGWVKPVIDSVGYVRYMLKGHKHSIALVKRLKNLFATGNYTQTELSRMFSVPQPTISVIIRGIQRKDI